MGHFLRKMCPTWGTLRDAAGHPWPGGGAIAPIAPPLYPPLTAHKTMVEPGGRESLEADRGFI